MASGTKVCTFFTSSSGNGCPFGAMCNFSHDVSSRCASGVLLPPGVPRVGGATGAPRRPQGRLTLPGVPPLGGATRAPRRQEGRLCRTDLCKEGTRCQNSNQETAIQAKEQGNVYNTGNVQNPARGERIRKCKYFCSSSGCRLGQNCRFLHEASNVAEGGSTSLEEVADSESVKSDISETRSTTSETLTHKAKKPTDTNTNTGQNVFADHRRPCRFFNSSDGCHLGKKCNYLHETPLTQEEEASLQKNDVSLTYIGEAKRRPISKPTRRRCRFFFSTRCKDGNGCRYTHSIPEEEAATGAGRTTAECKYFNSSTGCTDGTRCRYTHSAPKEQAAGNTAQSSGECKYFNSSTGCTDGTRCRYTHSTPKEQVAGNTAQSSGECKYFNSSTGCTDGTRCRYTHSTPKEQAAGNTAQSSGECKYFNSSTGCKDGTRCRYTHSTPKEQVAGNTAQSSGECKYFNSSTGCTDGERCHFIHEFPEQESMSQATSDAESRIKVSKKSQHPCKYFNTTDGCHHGDGCAYLHEAATRWQWGPRPNLGQHPAARAGLLQTSLSEMTHEEQRDARTTEIEVLKKRYPQAQEMAREKTGVAHRITFQPTDPDWLYDVRSLDMNIYFPQLYPKKMMYVSIPQQESLPETVKRCISFSIADWVSARFSRLHKTGCVERVFRPFLHWLDRHLHDIFTDALTHYKKELIAKASGIEIIPARHLQARYQQEEEEENENENEKEPITSNDVTNNVETMCSADESDKGEEGEEEEEEEDNLLLMTQFNPIPKGTEMKCKQLQLSEAVGTLVAVSVRLRMHCTRCKETAEVKAPNGRLNQLKCSRCSSSLLVRYHAALMHGFSSVLGYLDFEHCLPFDVLLIDCDFIANCMNCNRDNKLGGIPPGQPTNTWCMTCHTKTLIAMEGVQFRQLQPSAIEKAEGTFHVEGTKSIRKVHDPAIKEGRPLPAQGTCKHYKKSFRWLRFPCCGKTYPCDICHEENEDHDFKFANRMICGFCCHEQAYIGLKPCSACLSSLTNKSTEHWEGGKGCRDVIRMSRGDNKKYSNTNKTISRKASAQKPSGKKNTKIRHASS